MKLFVKVHGQNDYHQTSYGYLAMPVPPGIKPGDILYSLRTEYHVDKVEYSKSDLVVYATKS